MSKRSNNNYQAIINTLADAIGFKACNNNILLFRKRWGIYTTPLGFYIKNSKLNDNDIDYIIHKKNKAIYIEIIPHYKDNKLNNRLIEAGFNAIKWFTHILDISSGYKHVWDNYIYSKTRNQIRYAHKNNIIVKEVSAVEFYSAYSQIYPYKKKPYRLFKRLIADNYGQAFLSYVGDIVAGGGFFLFYDEEVFYFSGFVRDEFRRICPSHAIINTIIERYAGDYKTLNMGSSIGLKGVIKFKEGFGATKREYYIYRFKRSLWKLISGK